MGETAFFQGRFPRALDVGAGIGEVPQMPSGAVAGADAADAFSFGTHVESLCRGHHLPKLPKL